MEKVEKKDVILDLVKSNQYETKKIAIFNLGCFLGMFLVSFLVPEREPVKYVLADYFATMFTAGFLITLGIIIGLLWYRKRYLNYKPKDLFQEIREMEMEVKL